MIERENNTLTEIFQSKAPQQLRQLGAKNDIKMLVLFRKYDACGKPNF